MSMRPDWKSYLDGSMPLAERERVHAELERNPTLRRDFEGYQEFVSTLRERALAEPMPNLSFALPRPPLIRKSLLWVGAAALAGAVTFYAAQPREPEAIAVGPVFPDSPEIDRQVGNEPAKLSDWLVRRTSLNAPKVALKGVAQLESASYARDWAGYEFTCSAGKVRLRFAAKDGFEPCQTQRIGNSTFYRSGGLGWRQNGLSFYLTGDPKVQLEKLALAIVDEVSRSKSIGIAHTKGAL